MEQERKLEEERQKVLRDNEIIEEVAFTACIPAYGLF